MEKTRNMIMSDRIKTSGHRPVRNAPKICPNCGRPINPFLFYLNVLTNTEYCDHCIQKVPFARKRKQVKK